MIFIWTKNNLIGSKLIRWGLDEPCSHFAICFFEERGDSAPVVESRLGHGAQPSWFGDFCDRNEIVHALQGPSISGREESSRFHSVSSQLQGRSYDKYGILYWVYAVSMRKFFGKKLPGKNQWGRNELVYCVEVLETMPIYLKELGVDLADFDLEMTSPEMMYNMLIESQQLIDVTDHLKRD